MPDIKAPVLKRLVLPATIDLSKGDQAFTVLAQAEDEAGGSGIAYISVWFDRDVDFASGSSSLLQFGYAGSEDGFADATPTIGSTTAILRQSAPIATYNVASVWLTDNAGNVAKYDAQQLQALGIGTAIAVTGRPADVTPPVLKSLTFPTTIDLSGGGAGMTVTAEASDNAGGAGLETISMWLSRPLYTDGYGAPALTIIQSLVSDPQHPSRTFEIDQAALPGDYEITHVVVKDRVGNQQSYDAAQLAAMGIATGFTVTGNVPDTTMPELVDLWLPRTVSLQGGAEHAFALTARDPGGRGVRSVIATLDRPIQLSDGATEWLSVSEYAPGDTFVDGSPGFAVDRFRLSDATKPGTYNIKSLSVWDLAGNVITYSTEQLQARGFNTAMTVLDKAPTAAIVPSASDGKLVLSLSSSAWAARGTDSFALTLAVDPAALRLAGASVEGVPGALLSVSQAGSGSRITLSGSGALPADATVKLVLEPLGGRDSVQYAVESFRVNGLAQTFATGSLQTARFGSAGADLLDGAQGGFLDAGAGLDRVRFEGYLADYAIRRETQGIVVEHKGGQQLALAGVERLDFSDFSVALDVDGVAGQAYRLYQAAFDRTPDYGGIGFWMEKMDGGMPLATVARTFLQSGEFESKYGIEPSNEDFVTALYHNVLHRAPDADGFAFWIKALKANFDRADLLVEFSESPEYVAQVVGSIDTGFLYFPSI